MTTWANGDTLTAAWMNSVEQILALGTYGSVSAPRLTMAPSGSYSIDGNGTEVGVATGQVATNLLVTGSTTVTAGKYFEAISGRGLVTTTSGGVSTSSFLSFDHTSTINGLGAYGIIGALRSNSGTGKANAAYFRTVVGGTFNGAVDGLQVAVTYDTGATVNVNSALIGITREGTNTGAFPKGIAFSSNDAGSKLDNAIVILDSLQINTSVLQWNQRAATTGWFLVEYDPSSILIFGVDTNANIKWIKDGVQLTNNAVNVLQSYTSGDLKIGKASQATGDTTGRVFIPSVAGAPTGVPTDYTGVGYNALVYDRTNNKIYVYDDTANAWKSTAALT